MTTSKRNRLPFDITRIDNTGQDQGRNNSQPVSRPPSPQKPRNLSPDPAPPLTPRAPGGGAVTKPTREAHSPVREEGTPCLTMAARLPVAAAAMGLLSGPMLDSVNAGLVIRQIPGQGWWLEFPLSFPELTLGIWSAGGFPYGRLEHGWFPVSPAGEVNAQGRAIDPQPWPLCSLARLMAHASISPGGYAATSTIRTLVPAPMGRWLLGRGLALGLVAGLTPVVARPLADEEGETPMLLLTLTTSRGVVPSSLIMSFSRLPGVIVCIPHQGNRGLLLVEARHRAAVPPRQLADLVPDNEIWVLGAPDTGHWCLRPIGPELEHGQLLSAPDLSPVVVAPAPATAMPEPISIRLRPSSGSPARVDAILLDDQELQWIQPFLTGRPLSEQAFFIAGNGVHLFLSPGGVAEGVLPFGAPLTRIGPGGLYVEMGMAFHPTLPEASRKTLFCLDQDSVVVVQANEGACRFPLSALAPVWRLWLGEPVPIREQFSPQVREGLRQLGLESRHPSLFATMRRQALGKETQGSDGPRLDKQSLLEEALRAELANDLLRAAELLEAAGCSGAAGRMYERAARRI